MELVFSRWVVVVDNDDDDDDDDDIIVIAVVSIIIIFRTPDHPTHHLSQALNAPYCNH